MAIIMVMMLQEVDSEAFDVRTLAAVEVKADYLDRPEEVRALLMRPAFEIMKAKKAELA